MKKSRVALLGVAISALVGTSSAAAFTPTPQYFPKQWYLSADKAFDAWDTPPTFAAPVKIGIVDSGVDCSLPDLAGQIAKSKSFVGGNNGCTDVQGHGTVVAGEIAGALNSPGIVGLAYSSQLLVAKVVAPDGTIPIKAEAAGIRWVVDQGAQVVNLSFGAVRDPLSPELDTYSKAEAQAVAYAVKKGAVVVAAVGNADEAPTTPWEFASWPAALPHVIGVGALTKSGNVPDFSDRDTRFVDIAAPGVGIFSTFPAALTAQDSACTPQGYTDCATGHYQDYHNPEGTSFAAPQVSAAAAVLLGLHPTLTSSQVSRILERHTDDVDAASGCAQCATGRDKYSGWGALDVMKAVGFLDSGSPLPPSDHFEPNDSAAQAGKVWGKRPSVSATLDYWDDPVDVYRLHLDRGQDLRARLAAHWPQAEVDLTLWRPGLPVLRGHRGRVAATAHAGRTQDLSYRAPHAGWYYVELQIVHQGAGRYALRLTKGS